MRFRPGHAFDRMELRNQVTEKAALLDGWGSRLTERAVKPAMLRDAGLSWLPSKMPRARPKGLLPSSRRLPAENTWRISTLRSLNRLESATTARRRPLGEHTHSGPNPRIQLTLGHPAPRTRILRASDLAAVRESGAAHGEKSTSLPMARKPLSFRAHPLPLRPAGPRTRGRRAATLVPLGEPHRGSPHARSGMRSG